MIANRRNTAVEIDEKIGILPEFVNSLTEVAKYSLSNKINIR